MGLGGVFIRKTKKAKLARLQKAKPSVKANAGKSKCGSHTKIQRQQKTATKNEEYGVDCLLGGLLRYAQCRETGFIAVLQLCEVKLAEPREARFGV